MKTNNHWPYLGCCHTELHAAINDWPLTPNVPLIGGHEGVGTIVAIGKNTTESPVKLGDRVGIKWLAYSCLNCENCRKGLEQNCDNAQLSGFTVDGTFQEYAVICSLFSALCFTALSRGFFSVFDHHHSPLCP
jgi:propanol-preferring alcohol dehydrogenase